MKAVLISIAPEWCSQIVLGDKTMEVRKTRPRLETPFRVYIYCSKAKNKIGWVRMHSGGWQRLDGSVIGEFVCDEIRRVHIPCPKYQDKLDTVFTSESRMSYSALHNYCPEGDAYFWHICDLKVYDEPKELATLTALRETKFGYEPNKLKRAPQSWCYVEEP